MSGIIKANPMVICGPSGCGKSTLLKRLMHEYPSLFGFSVSRKFEYRGKFVSLRCSAGTGQGKSAKFDVDTTREPRKGEQEGKDYYFTEREKMQASIDAGDFIESAEYNKNLYGTSKQSVQSVMSAGKVCILDIDMQGVINVKKTDLTQTVYIFIKPPSLEELLWFTSFVNHSYLTNHSESRLRGRNTESDESVQRRMVIAKKEMEYASVPGNYHHIIINDKLEKCYADFKSIINKDVISLS